MPLGIASRASQSQCLLLPTAGSPGDYQKEQTAVGNYVDRLGLGLMTGEAGKGRGKAKGLLGTLGRLLLDCRVNTLLRGHLAHHTQGGEDLNPESSTHRLGTISAAVPRLIFGQPLFLLVQRPRLQDHLLQLKGGITVQAAFLWRDRVLSPACGSPPPPQQPGVTCLGTQGLHWAQSLAPPSFHSGRPTARGPAMGLSACLGDWRTGAQGSR